MGKNWGKLGNGRGGGSKKGKVRKGDWEWEGGGGRDCLVGTRGAHSGLLRVLI